jgi:hypothetical protein
MAVQSLRFDHALYDGALLLKINVFIINYSKKRLAVFNCKLTEPILIREDHTLVISRDIISVQTTGALQIYYRQSGLIQIII